MSDPRESVGVGPWEGPPPEGDHYDPELVREGDRRNVVDRYRYWRHEAIVADLDRLVAPVAVAVHDVAAVALADQLRVVVVALGRGTLPRPDPD